ncbi:MAG: hypothetical protein KJ053_09555 [Dehalococcoidia bacterium]|nr:hypothetical protein [Dehalococcoidia bacterium]
MEPTSAREAAERNAGAVMAGNLAQIMADITPGALTQMMAMGAQGGLSPTSMPNMTGYEIVEAGQDGDATTFHVTFESSMGKATLATTWKQVMGQWKITAIALVSAEPAAGA